MMKIKEIADFSDGKFSGDGETEIFRVASLENAETGEMSYVENVEKTENAAKTKASCLLVPENFDAEISCSLIKVKNPKLAFAKIAEKLHPPKKRFPEIHHSAVIANTAKFAADIYVSAFCRIGEDSEIGAKTQILDGTKIGDNVKIGANCTIHPNCTIYDDVLIGNNVILHAGVIIGADGFGYVRVADSYTKFPQIGTVVIENDVEIGANTCIDRGALGKTRIGEGTKIDNLVQIAHNVSIGKRVVIASQTGISGSTIIEDDCVIGGQVGFGDHATVKSGAIIGSKAGVLPGKIVREGVWWGVPVQPLDEYKRQNALVKSLPRMREQLKELKKMVEKMVNRKS